MAGEREMEERGDRQASRFLFAPLAALQFLTLVPPIVRCPFTPVELGRAVGYFPLVGALLGGLLAGLNWGLVHLFPSEVSAVLVLAAWVIFTGALHLDGFLDTCDGLFGGHTPESRLRIMRDEQVGAFGVVGGVLLLVLKATALVVASRRTLALLMAPLLARWGVTLALVAFPYARPEGLGRTMKDHAGWGQLALATATAFAVAWFAAGWLGLIAMALTGVAAWTMARFVLTRLPGLTGDIYGAICEMAEVLALLFFATGVEL
jgi:adenosylcobinamide-GDP ribazoletransferase